MVLIGVSRNIGLVVLKILFLWEFYCKIFFGKFYHSCKKVYFASKNVFDAWTEVQYLVADNLGLIVML